MFLLIVAFYLKKKLKTELKNFKHGSHTISLSKGTILPKKHLFFAKKC